MPGFTDCCKFIGGMAKSDLQQLISRFSNNYQESTADPPEKLQTQHDCDVAVIQVIEGSMRIDILSNPADPLPHFLLPAKTDRT